MATFATNGPVRRIPVRFTPEVRVGFVPRRVLRDGQILIFIGGVQVFPPLS